MYNGIVSLRQPDEQISKKTLQSKRNTQTHNLMMDFCVVFTFNVKKNTHTRSNNIYSREKKTLFWPQIQIRLPCCSRSNMGTLMYVWVVEKVLHFFPYKIRFSEVVRVLIKIYGMENVDSGVVSARKQIKCGKQNSTMTLGHHITVD